MGGKNGGGNRVLLVPDPCSPSGVQADPLTTCKAFQIHPVCQHWGAKAYHGRPEGSSVFPMEDFWGPGLISSLPSTLHQPIPRPLSYILGSWETRSVCQGRERVIFWLRPSGFLPYPGLLILSRSFSSYLFPFYFMSAAADNIFPRWFLLAMRSLKIF